MSMHPAASRYTPLQLDLNEQHKARERRMHDAARARLAALPAPEPSPAPVLARFGSPLDRVKEAVEAVRPTVRATSSAILTAKDIKAEVAAQYFLTVDTLIGRCRLWEVVRPRQIAMYLTHVICPKMSLPQIGRAFNRDHTTILSALYKIRRLVATDPVVDAEIKELLVFLATAPTPPVADPHVSPVDFYGRKPMVNRAGIRYGMLIVIDDTPVSFRKGNKIDWLWNCKCDCGDTKLIRADRLRSKTRGLRNCGCLLRESARQRAILRPRAFGGRFTPRPSVLSDIDAWKSLGIKSKPRVT
jgi:hypothetical protein